MSFAEFALSQFCLFLNKNESVFGSYHEPVTDSTMQSHLLDVEKKLRSREIARVVPSVGDSAASHRVLSSATGARANVDLS